MINKVLWHVKLGLSAHEALPHCSLWFYWMFQDVWGGVFVLLVGRSFVIWGEGEHMVNGRDDDLTRLESDSSRQIEDL